MIFEFFKKLFGIADEGSRKRRAEDSVSFSKEFVTPKKHRCNNTTARPKPVNICLEDDSDDDDIEVISEFKYHNDSPCNWLNGSHENKDQSFSFYSAPSFYSSCVKSPVHNNCNKSNMGHYSNQNHRIPISNCHHRNSTLYNVTRLKEKKQYQEVLQNFISLSRIHVIKDKSDEQLLQEPIEVIDLENTESENISKKSTSIQSPNLSRISCISIPDRSKFMLPLEKKETSKWSLLRKDHPSKNGIHDAHPLESTRIETISNSALKDKLHQKKLEIIATNTLREKLADKPVTKGDFVPQVTRRYNEREEQRNREVKELQRLTSVLSLNNRLAREAVLDEQLARSNKLREVILDETEFEEEEKLPKLTLEMVKEIDYALIPRPPDEVLVEGFGLRITRKDMNTLADLNWLNDEIINFYMNLLIARGGQDKFPKVHAMNTFFYPKLISNGHSSLKRWTRKIDIFAQDLVVVPVHLGMHWCMSVIDFRDKSIKYYDSMGSSNSKCLNSLKQYLEEESLDKKKKSYDTNDWKLENVKNIPQQMNGSDCGVFSCVFAEYICANRKMKFSQQDMPYFRNKMVYEILKSKLL